VLINPTAPQLQNQCFTRTITIIPNIKTTKSTWLSKVNKGKSIPYHKKSFSNVNPSLEDYSSFSRKISQKVGSSGKYTSKLAGGNKSRIKSEK
jgi:hypothetical protein